MAPLCGRGWLAAARDDRHPVVHLISSTMPVLTSVLHGLKSGIQKPVRAASATAEIWPRVAQLWDTPSGYALIVSGSALDALRATQSLCRG